MRMPPDFFGKVVLALALPVAMGLPVRADEAAARRGKILFHEDFETCDEGSGLPDGWWSEGSTLVSIDHGRLRVNANFEKDSGNRDAATIWLNRKFGGDLKVEFDAHVLASNEEKNNINFFFLFSDPSGKDLIESRGGRSDGQYQKYHELKGYVFTFLANGNPGEARFRLRDDPGFHLLLEKNAYECRQGKTYHITIMKRGSRITCAVDGEVYLDFVDDKGNPEHKSGLIGLRTWHTEIWWDNLKVTQLP